MQALFITDSNKKDKTEAIRLAATQAGFEVEQEALSIAIANIRPLSKQEIETQAVLRATTMQTVFACVRHPRPVYFVGMQKGATIDNNGTLMLLCCTATANTANTQIHIAWSSSVLLPTEVRWLVKSGVEIYKAYEKVLGESFDDPNKSICKFLTGQEESSWMAEGAFKSFIPYSENFKKYFTMHS